MSLTLRFLGYAPYAIILASVAATSWPAAFFCAAFLLHAYSMGYSNGRLRERFRQIGFVPPEEGKMPAEVVNIPLKSDDLYMMRLEPVGSCALFRYITEKPGVWYVVQCHVEAGVTALEENREEPGGVVLIHPVPLSKLDKRLTAQAERITREQFKVWREMSIQDRITLQIVWAEDALRFSEQALVRALQRPFPEGVGMGMRYNYALLSHLMASVENNAGELRGLQAAQESLLNHDEEPEPDGA